jgi:hypothetical protein
MHISASTIKSYFEAAGFVNITIVDFKLPMSPWPEDPRLNEAGAAMMLSALDDLEGMSIYAFKRILGWDTDELQKFLKKVRREWIKLSVHGYWNL